MTVGTSPFDSTPQTLSTPEGDISYWIIFPEGYEEQITNGEGNTTSLRFAVAWQDAVTFKKYAMGFTQTGGSGSWFNRITPMQNPWQPGQWLTDLRKVTVANFSPNTDLGYSGTTFGVDSNGWPTAGFIIYQATFVSRNYPIMTDELMLGMPRPDGIYELNRYVRKTWRVAPKERKVRGYTFVADNPGGTGGIVDGTPIEDSGFFPLYEKEYVYTWLQVPFAVAPLAQNDAILINVNYSAFDGFAAGTMLFKGYAGELAPYVGPDENLYIDIPYLFGYRPQTWNKYPLWVQSQAGPVWVGLKVQGSSSGSSPPYSSADFSQLFKPGTF